MSRSISLKKKQHSDESSINKKVPKEIGSPVMKMGKRLGRLKTFQKKDTLKKKQIQRNQTFKIENIT